MSLPEPVGGIVAGAAGQSRSVSDEAGHLPWIERSLRYQVVQLDLVMDSLTRADEGLSRAETVELRDRLETITAALSEVAGTI